MSTKTQKPRFVSSISVGQRGLLSIAEIRQIAKSDPHGFLQKIETAAEKGEFTWGSVRDLKGLCQALIDVECKATIMDSGLGLSRSIDTSAFPLLCGTLTVAGVNAAYEAIPTIGQELVEDMQDNKKVTTLAAAYSLGKTGPKGVAEGKEFPEIGASEEKVQIGHKRDGAMISITAETIEENNVSDIVGKVNALGQIGAETVEEQTLSRVSDQNGSAASPVETYVYRLNGAGTPLYTTTANAPTVRSPSGTRVINNALQDEDSLEAVRTRLNTMRDMRSKRIQNWANGEMILLVPDALVPIASKIINSDYVPGVENEVSNWGPRGQYRPRLLSSPKLDDISATAWYMGRFKRQFKRKWKLMNEIVSMSGNTEEFLRTRVAYRSRIAWDVEIGAADHVYVVQSLAGTVAATAPSAAND